MGNLVLISGPNGSGKSRFAEELVSRTTGERFYIATMRSQNEENDRRIEKHRRQRAGMGFHTLELPWQICEVALPGDAVVLLEDVSNLLGNIIFEKGGTGEDAFAQIQTLKDRCALLVAVTISGLSGDGYDEETAAYVNALNELNGRLVELSQVAVGMHDGQAICEKGDIHEIH